MRGSYIYDDDDDVIRVCVCSRNSHAVGECAYVYICINAFSLVKNVVSVLGCLGLICNNKNNTYARIIKNFIPRRMHFERHDLCAARFLVCSLCGFIIWLLYSLGDCVFGCLLFEFRGSAKICLY